MYCKNTGCFNCPAAVVMAAVVMLVAGKVAMSVLVWHWSHCRL